MTPLAVSFPVLTVANMKAGIPVTQRFAGDDLAIALFASESAAIHFRDTQAAGCNILRFDQPKDLCKYLRTCVGATGGKATRITWNATADDSGRMQTLPLQGFVEALEHADRDDLLSN